MRSVAMLLVLLLMGALTPAAWATETTTPGGDDPHAKTHHHNRHAALFIGQTRHHGHNTFTLGGDVAYRFKAFHHRLSGGAFIDATFGDSQHTIVGPALFIHPLSHLKVMVAPAVEFKKGHSHTIFRAGIGYDVSVGGLALTPAYNIDFIGGEAVQVYGLTLGIGF